MCFQQNDKMVYVIRIIIDKRNVMEIIVVSTVHILQEAYIKYVARGRVTYEKRGMSGQKWTIFAKLKARHC